MKPLNAKAEAAVASIASRGGRITTGSVAVRAKVSAPTAYKALMALVDKGLLEHVGAGRGAHFRPIRPPLAAFTKKRAGLEESEAWKGIAELPEIHDVRKNVHEILNIGFTEMVNNAIDHSMGKTVKLRVFQSDGVIGFEVEDDGIGIFEGVMQKFSLKSPFEAIAELQKGKVTTMPDVHSGQGIFFTSKMADKMTLESGATRWLIDTSRDDHAVEVSPARDGTLVRFEIDVNSPRDAKAVYDRFSTVEGGFTRSRTAVKLFRGEGGPIVSRSEAKRLLAGLEKFEEVELDFRDVLGIGQGFADEVFRVWQRQHPDTRLIPSHANDAVMFMIRSARANQGSSPIGIPSASFVSSASVIRNATVTQSPSTTVVQTSTGHRAPDGSNEELPRL